MSEFYDSFFFVLKLVDVIGSRVPILVSDGVDFERSGVEREWRDPLHSAHSTHILLYPLSLSAPLQALKTTLEWILSGWSGF